MRAELYLIPNPVNEERLAGKTLVLIDVLRASTTICKALSVGAKAVIPVERPGEAAELRANIGIEDTILAGERKGIKIENFDLGNSPQEYSEDSVRDKTIILTTSNGTQTYSRASHSSLILTGAIVNISAVADRAAEVDKDLAIICAGDEGDFSIEDTLCGGMLLDVLINRKNLNPKLNDAASLALLLYRSNKENLGDAVANGEHGRYLTEIGFGDDVRLAAEADSIPVLPILKDRRILREEY